MAFWRAFFQAPSAIIGVAALTVVIAVAIFAPPLFGTQATQMDLSAANQGVSFAHPLGTDALGRDLLTRLLVATRLSVGLALIAEVIAFFFGVLMGALTAVVGVRKRALLARSIDTMIAFPSLILTICVVIVLEPRIGLLGVAVALAVPSTFYTARLVSTLTLSLGRREYVLAAGLTGVGTVQLIGRHLVPNASEALITSFTVGITFKILALSGLSFLGLGVQPPQFDWGTILTEGVNAFYLNPIAALGPVTFVAFAAMSFTLVGEALARATNPVTWTEGSGRSKHVPSPATRALPSDVNAAQSATLNGSWHPSPYAAVAVHDLRVSFQRRGGASQVIRGISFEVARGEVLGIVGESGSGKTMTALALGGLVPYPGEVSGTITIRNHDVGSLTDVERSAFLGKEMAYVFQDPSSSLNPALTIGQQMTEASRLHLRLDERAATEMAIQGLTDVNIGAADRLLSRRPHELSGGMRQRVMIAMGLMHEPSVIVLDEPTTALDVTVQAQVMDVIASAIRSRHNTAAVMISHNLALVRQNCDRVVVMYAGRIVEDVPAADLIARSRHPYTKLLLEAVPDVDRARGASLQGIPGFPPDPSSSGQGCLFAARCPVAKARCLVDTPPLFEFDDGDRAACWVAAEQKGAAVLAGDKR